MRGREGTSHKIIVTELPPPLAPTLPTFTHESSFAYRNETSTKVLLVIAGFITRTFRLWEKSRLGEWRTVSDVAKALRAF